MEGKHYLFNCPIGWPPRLRRRIFGPKIGVSDVMCILFYMSFDLLNLNFGWCGERVKDV
jgi:hypothetical protein